jgi:SAM-dependent methyltransferase
VAQRFRDISNLEEARAYYEGLADRWPERAAVIEHLCGEVAQIATQNQCTVVELCAGGGQLAFPLLSRFPNLRYLGFDSSEHGIVYAREKLAPFATRVELYEMDLNDNAWLAKVPERVDACLSLQSLHDLGDAEAVARIYRVTHDLLTPGGRWILADFLEHSSDTPAADPGRLTVEKHLELFDAAGYATAHCTMQTRNFGCFVAKA